VAPVLEPGGMARIAVGQDDGRLRGIDPGARAAPALGRRVDTAAIARLPAHAGDVARAAVELGRDHLWLDVLVIGTDAGGEGHSAASVNRCGQSRRAAASMAARRRRRCFSRLVIGSLPPLTSAMLASSMAPLGSRGTMRSPLRHKTPTSVAALTAEPDWRRSQSSCFMTFDAPRPI